MLSRLNRRRRTGLTLFGSLMALAVFASLLLGVAQWWQDRLEEERQERAAGQIAILAEAARTFVLDRFPTLLAGAADQEVTLAELRAADVLSDDFRDRDATGRQYRVLLHRPSTGVLDLLVTQVVASGDLRWPWRAAAAAPVREMRLGTIDPAATGRLQGPTIDVSVTPFQTAWSVPEARAMATWIRLDRETVYGNQLYRVAASGFPEINRMETDLDMAGHDIVDAGAVTAATLEITSDMTVGEGLTVTGDLLVGASVSVTGTIDVAGALTATSATVADAASAAAVTATGAVRGASLTVTGGVTAGTIGASGAMTVTGSATMDDLTAASVAASTITATSVTASDVTVQQMTASGRMTAANAGITRLVVGSCSGC